MNGLKWFLAVLTAFGVFAASGAAEAACETERRAYELATRALDQNEQLRSSVCRDKRLCLEEARLQKQSCKTDAKDEKLICRAECDQLSGHDKRECKSGCRKGKRDAKASCREELREARGDCRGEEQACVDANRAAGPLLIALDDAMAVYARCIEATGEFLEE